MTVQVVLSFTSPFNYSVRPWGKQPSKVFFGSKCRALKEPYVAKDKITFQVMYSVRLFKF